MSRSDANAGIDPDHPAPPPPPDRPDPTALSTRPGVPLVPILAVVVLVGAIVGGAWWRSNHRGELAGREPQADATAGAPPDRSPADSDATRTPADRDSSAPGATGSAPQGAPARADLEALTRRLDQLQRRLDATPAPAASSAHDLDALRSRLDALEKLPQQLGPLSDRLQAAERRIDKMEQGLASLRQDVAALRDMEQGLASLRQDVAALRDMEQGLASLRQDVAALRDEVRKSPPDAPAPEPAGDELRTAIDQFKRREYEAARDRLRRLEKDTPDDARVWYYAALANGFATGDWRGETERLADQGVARERAGTPPRAVIDAAFADLTDASGAGWLAYYRRRAQGPGNEPSRGESPAGVRR